MLLNAFIVKPAQTDDTLIPSASKEASAELPDTLSSSLDHKDHHSSNRELANYEKNNHFLHYFVISLLLVVGNNRYCLNENIKTFHYAESDPIVEESRRRSECCEASFIFNE
jgi:hypothetical protein